MGILFPRGLQDRQVVLLTRSKEADAFPLQGFGKRQKYFITMKASPESPLLRIPPSPLPFSLHVFIHTLYSSLVPFSLLTSLERECLHRVRVFLRRNIVSEVALREGERDYKVKSHRNPCGKTIKIMMEKSTEL